MEQEQYVRVSPTPEEVAEFRSKHNGHAPGVYRYRCTRCELRLWGSGIGIGAHNRSARCREIHRLHQLDEAANGNVFSHCGCKYWKDGKCVDCGELLSEAREHQDEILEKLSQPPVQVHRPVHSPIEPANVDRFESLYQRATSTYLKIDSEAGDSQAVEELGDILCEVASGLRDLAARVEDAGVDI